MRHILRESTSEDITFQHINTKEEMLKHDLLKQHIQQQKEQRAISAPTRWQSKKDRQVAEQRKTPGAGQRVWAFTSPHHLRLYPNFLSSPPSLSFPTTLYLPLPTQTLPPLHITHLNGQDNNYNHTAMNVSPSHEQLAGSPAGQQYLWTVFPRTAGSIDSPHPSEGASAMSKSQQRNYRRHEKQKSPAKSQPH